MNILILTGRFGMGHYSVAEAVKQEIIDNCSDINVYVIDILEYLIPNTSKIIYNSFNVFVTKGSNLYNFINRSSEEHCKKNFNSLFIGRIDKLLLEYKPDIIISTLPISCGYISKYKTVRKCNIPLFTVITDISSHSEWIYPNTDYYFVGDQSIKQKLIDKGNSAETIIVTGIPVKHEFKYNVLDGDGHKIKHVLIMGGGLGLISFSETLFEMLDNTEDINTTIITGNNKSMYEYVKNKYKKINVIGYTNKVNEYMRNADIIISKSGGITLFEAIYSEIPICVINPFLMQEIKNAKYIEEKNIGKVIWKESSNTDKSILELIKDENVICEMKNNMKKVKEQINQDEIITIIEKFKKGA